MKFRSNLFKGLRSLEAEPQVAIRRWRNPPLKPGVRPGFQTKLTNKERPSFWTVFSMSALCARSFSRPAGRDYFFVLIDFPSREIGKIKRRFRTLRSPASLRGWTAPGRRPGPACRLRAGLVRCDSFFEQKKTARFSMLRKTKQIKILFFSQNKKSEQNNSRQINSTS